MNQNDRVTVDLSTLSPRRRAGTHKAAQEFRDSLPDDDLQKSISDEDYVALRVDPTIDSYATQYAPNEIRLPQFLARWTPEERAAAFALGAQSAEVAGLWQKLLAVEFVHLDNEDLVAGVPLVCAALQQMGVMQDGIARANEIMAY